MSWKSVIGKTRNLNVKNNVKTNSKTYKSCFTEIVVIIINFNEFTENKALQIILNVKINNCLNTIVCSEKEI